MTNKEFLINTITKMFHVSTDFATECYSEMNKCDWKILCSKMGDYDHPNERIEARKEFDSWLNTFTTEEEFKNKCRICDWLDDNDFYSNKFYDMNEEYKNKEEE